MNPHHPALMRHTVAEHTTSAETDVLELLVTLYETDFSNYNEQQHVIESLTLLNEIPDPLKIPRDTKILYLPNTAWVTNYCVKRHRVQARVNGLHTILNEIDVYEPANDTQREQAVESLASLNNIADVNNVSRLEILYFACSEPTRSR